MPLPKETTLLDKIVSTLEKLEKLYDLLEKRVSELEKRPIGDSRLDPIGPYYYRNKGKQ